jgi:hypothetical protein
MDIMLDILLALISQVGIGASKACKMLLSYLVWVWPWAATSRMGRRLVCGSPVEKEHYLIHYFSPSLTLESGL